MAISEATAAIIAAGIGAAGSMGSVGVSNARNMRLAKYSADFQRQMVKEQNEYNSPVSQMERYKQAGLNPNLMFGNIGEGNQSEIAKYSPPDIQPVPYGEAGKAVSSAVMQALQFQQMKADLDIKHQEYENLKEEQFRIRADRHSRDIDNMWNALTKGFNPGLITSEEDWNKMKDSVGFHLYDQKLKNEQQMYEYRGSQKAYMDAQTEVARMNKKEKEYFIDNIQPLMRDIMDKRKEGLDYSNDLLKLQRNWYRADKIFNYTKGVADAVARFISPVNIGSSGGNSTPNSWYGSPMYPSESYVPGLP